MLLCLCPTVATGHMRGHAIVLDCASRVREACRVPDDLQLAAKEEREGQIELASAFIRSGKETL